MATSVITLDVGGTIFKTLKSTLVLNSEYFKRLFDEESFAKVDNSIFIDSNPRIFSILLDMWRGYPVLLTSLDAATREMVLAECARYGCSEPPPIKSFDEDDVLAIYNKTYKEVALENAFYKNNTYERRYVKIKAIIHTNGDKLSAASIEDAAIRIMAKTELIFRNVLTIPQIMHVMTDKDGIRTARAGLPPRYVGPATLVTIAYGDDALTCFCVIID